MIVETNLPSRQLQAFNLLRDNKSTELFFGGGAGGGKSYLGCFWLVYSCLNYPSSRWLLGRARLKTLKESTLLTLFQVLRTFKLQKDKDWKFNMIEGTVYFSNESSIYLKDLSLYPSDPEFDSLGSTEYTGAFIDEVSEITEKAKNIVMSRIRYKLDEFKLVPKLFLASNPAKNFAYREFWKPFIENRLPEHRKFIPALVGDNPFISAFYAENLKKMDNNSMQRLLYGNWDYDDDPSRLFDYESVVNMFELPQTQKDREMYLSADIARFGADKSVVMVWEGTRIIKVYAREKQGTDITEDAILSFAKLHAVPLNHIVIDEDGLGGGVVDHIKGSEGFVNGSRPYEILKEQMITRHNFRNLKTQCYVKLSEYIKEGKISCEPITMEIKERIIEDLQQIKIKDIDKDGKRDLIPKEIIKENLGRSPDFGDAMMMRMLFEVKPRSMGFIPIVGGPRR